MFNSPNVANCSPYELVFGRKPKLLLDLETDSDIKISGTYKEYYLNYARGFSTCINYCKILG